ncbi:MAG: esterase/lipase family protein [Burkholderiales bacterium]
MDAIAKRIGHALFGSVMLLATSFAAADNGSVGVVLMHGKWGNPGQHIDTLAAALASKGFRVGTPEMPWSKRRAYDKSADDALNEVDAEVAKLRDQGARRIVIAGHSLGAAGALAYAARRPVDAIALIAPGHVPESRVIAAKFAADVNKAREMVSAGKGDETAWFPDFNTGNRSASMKMTARTYISYFDPASTMNFSRNVESVKPGTRVLWVEPLGEEPPLRSNLMRIFSLLPQGLNVKLLEPDANHMSAPERAAAEIVNWVKTAVAQAPPKN